MPRPRIALVSREVQPFGGGGIGAYVAATAELLADVADVTIFTSSLHERRRRELRAAGASLPPGHLVFVSEPRGFELDSFRGRMHLWSARVRDALRRHYGERGPDLVEFQDFLGEGFVTAQDRRAGASWLRRTAVCVRINTTAELCDVLNGHLRSDVDTRVTFELERSALSICDHVLWPGGDVLETYRRYYGAGALAEPLLLRQAFSAGSEPHPQPALVGDEQGPLRLLYIGRFERRKGVLELVRALSGLRREDWRATLVGADSETAPLGQSMRAMAELAVGSDSRFQLREAVDRGEIAELIDLNDLVVIPSLWECWPNVGLEALERNRPLLATPTGGLVEMAVPGRSGLLAQDNSSAALATALEEAFDSRAKLTELAATGGPRAVFETLTAPEPIRAHYLELCERARDRAPPQPRRDPAPLVSIVIPYFGLPDYVGEAVASAFAQTYAEIEVIVVDDGSFADDAVLAGLAARHPIRVLVQQNSGLGAARNFGISQARGTYVLPLDADNALHSEFLTRCVDLLEARPDLAYVTAWTRFVDDRGAPWRGIDNGERPLGGESRMLTEANVAGDAAAVIRRAVFEGGHAYDVELTSYEDWDFYRGLAEAGLRGAVIPEPLIDYRVREASMARTIGVPNRERLGGELNARAAAREVRWTTAAASAAAPGWDERSAAELAAAATRLARSRDARAGAAAASALARDGGVTGANAAGRPPAVRWISARARTIGQRARLLARRMALRVLR
jgi:glycosyltransferase involved in cell wall biosynthesis